MLQSLPKVVSGSERVALDPRLVQAENGRRVAVDDLDAFQEKRIHHVQENVQWEDIHEEIIEERRQVMRLQGLQLLQHLVCFGDEGRQNVLEGLRHDIQPSFAVRKEISTKKSHRNNSRVNECAI